MLKILILKIVSQTNFLVQEFFKQAIFQIKYYLNYNTYNFWIVKEVLFIKKFLLPHVKI
jgi:hypothetical protein